MPRSPIQKITINNRVLSAPVRITNPFSFNFIKAFIKNQLDNRRCRSFPLKAGGAVTLKLFAAPASLLRNPAIAGVEPRRGENLRVVITISKFNSTIFQSDVD